MTARDDLDLDPALSDVVRRTYVRPVDEDVASRHLSAIVTAAAQPSAVAPERDARRRAFAWRPAVGAGVVATLLLPVGLATAGVSLPRAVEAPYRVVGITLPNQPAAKPAPRHAVPAPVTPGSVPESATTTTAGPAGTAAARAGRSQSARKRRPAGAGTSERPSTSRAPGTPAAASQGTTATSKPAVPRQPGATPRKPATKAPGARRKPATPAKPATPQSSRPSPATGRKPSSNPASPQAGTARPKVREDADSSTP